MKVVESGDVVKVHYTGKLKNGEVFDTSAEREPLEIAVDSGMVIEGFNEGLKGMKEGDKKTVEIPVEKAYGPRNDDFVLDVEKDKLPPDLEPEVGMQLSMSNPDPNGQPIPVKIIKVEDASIKIDANPPLAGEDLVFDLECVGIMKK